MKDYIFHIYIDETGIYATDEVNKYELRLNDKININGKIWLGDINFDNQTMQGKETKDKLHQRNIQVADLKNENLKLYRENERLREQIYTCEICGEKATKHTCDEHYGVN